jgi:hypothetical protein
MTFKTGLFPPKVEIRIGLTQIYRFHVSIDNFNFKDAIYIASGSYAYQELATKMAEVSQLDTLSIFHAH